MAAIEIRALSKRFGAVEAVRELSIEIDPGELVALVGPSGCGKTTLLRMIAGFEHPDAGGIFLGGRDVVSDEPARRRVGMVFQDYALFPHMTVADNIAYGLKFSGLLSRSGRAERIDELLSMVGLTGFGGRAPHELSAGQQQRVALARALAPNPEVLLLDEPMSALDALLREELRTEIRRVQRKL
ncbi:MAG TPA: ABC transporter ATP-binding protein, partial [Spirochaetia bacterium]|nr:ABC transporter ATP-binding protein [Spirochaetia bacterium]